jgi:hypothetical protein
VSLVMLEEYVDANGGFDQVDKGKQWAGIGRELGVGKDMGEAIRKMYLSQIRSNWIDPTNSHHNDRDYLPTSSSDRATASNESKAKSPKKKSSNKQTGQASHRHSLSRPMQEADSVYFRQSSHPQQRSGQHRAHAAAPAVAALHAAGDREMRPGAAIEADLDDGTGAFGWIPGFVTKVKQSRGTFRAAFRRPQDPVASELRFETASEGVEWRWPAAPADAAVPAAAASMIGPEQAVDGVSPPYCARAANAASVRPRRRIFLARPGPTVLRIPQ